MKRAVIIMLLVAAAAIILIWVFTQTRRPAPDRINVSGNIEATQVELSFRLPGWVEERAIDEGEATREGLLIARLDDTELARQVRLREAEMQQAQQALAELEAGSRPQEIAEAAAVVEGAKAEVERYKLDFDRQVKLHQTDVISSREFDVARDLLDSAKARLAEVQERLSLVKEGPRKEEIAQAAARLQQSLESLAISQTQLSYATLYSPLAGVVLSKNVEPGEYVSAGTPIVTVADLVHIWLRAYVDETDLGRVKLGQKAHVTTDTYPGRAYQGRISFISSQAEFTPKSVQTEKERVKLVYRIKIDIRNADMELKPGMPADAEIFLIQAQQ